MELVAKVKTLDYIWVGMLGNPRESWIYERLSIEVNVMLKI
jgi:hypothetical protein